MGGRDIAVLVILGVGAYLALRSSQTSAATRYSRPAVTGAGTPSLPSIDLTAIFDAFKSPAPVTRIPGNAQPGQPGHGWQYFSDGTAIDPQGRYYQGGKLIWSPGA